MANTFLENASKGKVNTNLKNLSQLPTNQFQAIPMPTVRKTVDMMINAPQPNSQDFTDRINAVNDFSNYYLSLPDHEEVGPMERYTLASMLQPAFKEVSTDFIAKNLESYTESLLGTKLSQNWRKEFADQWNAYDIQEQIADMQRMIMFSSEDNPNDEFYEKKIEELKTQAALLTKDFDKRSKVAQWTIDSAGLANQRIRQLASSLELGMLLGLINASVYGVQDASNLLKFKQASGALNGTLVAGKNGTSYLVKPVYNALGEQTTRSQLAMAVGNQLYMNTDMMKVEMGDAFQTIRDYRDEEGNRVPKSIARKWAENYGTLVLATEQSDEILDVIFSKYGISFGSIFTQIGLGRDWFKQAANLMKSNGFIQKVKNLLGLGVGVVSEAGQEGVQAAGQEALVQAAIMESNKKGYTNIDLGTIKDRSEKIWNALKTEFTDTSGSFIISKVFETTLGFTAYGAKKFIHPVSVKAKSDANAHFKPGGKIVNPFEIDTMGAVAEAPETKVDKDGKVIDEKLNAIFVDSPDVNGLQRGYSERDRKLIQWAREQGWEGIRVVEVPFSASQSVAERLANIINEDVAENFINESEQEGYTPNTDVDDIEDVDTSVNMEVPVVGTKDGDILVKNDASFEKVKEYFKNNSFTQSIITNDDGSISVRLSAGDLNASVNVRVANEAEINGTDRKVVKVQTKADWATEMETLVSSNPFGKDEYLYSYEEYQTIKKLEDILAPQADKLKDNDIEMMGQSIRGAAKVMPIVSDVFGKPTSEILEKFVFTIDPESEKLKIRDDKGNLIDEAIAGIETTKKNGVQRYRITIGKNVRSDTLMHEIIHGLRKMATPEQLSGFAEAYGGTVGGMWLEDIKKVDGGYRLGDTVYKNEDDAKKAASKYEERFVDDFMRYLYSHEGFNDAQRTFFSKVQQFFEEFWDQMRSILSKELDASVVRAFDILFGKDTPVQERADFIEVAATEGIRTAVDLANTGLEDAIERDEENGLDEEGNTLWQRAGDINSEQFINWFKGSKVVNSDGSPMVVYHGTNELFEDFEHGKASNTYANSAKNGFFFTSNRRVADSYLSNRRLERIESGEIVDIPTNPRVMEVYLHMENPLEFDAKSGEKKTWNDIFEEAKKNGHDGIIIRNIIDAKTGALSAEDRQYYGEADDYIVFSNDQIRIKNSGLPENNALYQRIMDRNTQARIDADYEAVENALRADSSNFDSDGNHLAPNGKKSNLTYRQWVQVRTPAFMNWFGDWISDPKHSSMVVDENGEPKVVYHGTINEFDTFEINKIRSSQYGYGFYFADFEEIGEAYGNNVISAFLNIRKPVFARSRVSANLDKLNKVVSLMRERGYTFYDQVEDFVRVYGENGGQAQELFDEFLDLKNFLTDEDFDEEQFLVDLRDVQTEVYGTDGYIVKNYAESSHTVYVAWSPNQIKSATDNSGEFSTENDSILYQTQEDKEYFDALNAGDMDKAQRIIEQVANAKGYSTDSSYQGTSAFNGSAPSSNTYYSTKEERRSAYDNGEAEGDWSLGDYADGYDPLNIELFINNPNMARTDFAKESVRNLKQGIKDRTITMYRSVPKSIKETSFRNGDWVTPSRGYAIDNAEIHGWEEGYRIIEQKVSIDDIWWDGNDINEWGYDDGKSYAYRNTKNNVKSFETIVRDENGNIIPPSKRFNYKNESVLFQLSDEERKKALESRKYEIETATAGGYWVRTEYIEEFAGEDWADRELKVRHWMQDSPDDYKELKDIARRVGDYQEFKEELHKKYEDNWFEEDESFYKRIYQLAQTRTAQEKDSEFIARNVMGDDNLLKTAKALRGYADLDFVPKPGRRSGGYYKVVGQLNRAKGVSNKVRSLSNGERGSERSTSEEIQTARELILKNPRAYRIAYERAMLGENRASIIRGIEDKKFEVNAVRQESNDLTMDYDLDTLDDRLEAELYSMEEEQLQAERKANLNKAKQTDWKKTAAQLEKKLAQANADLEKLNTEKLSRQQAQKERDIAISERNELRKQMTELQNELSETKAERSEFKAQRNERRKRVAELRKQLVEANRKVRTLSRILDAYERREAARNAKEVRDTMIAKIRKTVRIGKTTFSWHKDALDASYADAFAFINGIFAKVDRSDLYAKRKELEDLIDEMIEQQRDPKEIDAIDDELENIKEQIRGSEMRKVPEVLVPYLGSLQKADNRHSKWTLEELSNLLTVAQTIRQLAKDAFAPRFNAVQTERNNTVVNYVKEMSGIDISQMKADERRRLASTFPKDVLVRNVVLENLDWWRALAANPAGMTRFFDGEKEGVIFDFFTRQVRQQMQQEIERENERYQAGKEKIKELGLNSIELNKVIELEDGYTYKKANGEKVKLTVDNGIDVYIYMQNEDAKMKLLHVSGNGLTEKLAKRIIDALTPEQKAWGDWMMAELESHRQDSADIMYNVYNSIMGQVDRYFPLVSADRLYGGDDGLDIMSGAEGSTKRYVNKGHTKERVKVIYPLDLNATRTWVTAVKREEHFVAFAKWARDAQYYMDTKTPAGIRNVILQKYGPKNIEIFSDYVNSIANAKSYSDNVDKLLSTIIGRGAVSAVAGKLSVMFKQVATLPAVIGKTSFKNFLGSAFAPRVTLENFLKANEILFADYTSARDFVNKKDPIMANRKYGTELIGSLTNMGKKPIDAVASNVSEWIMRHSAGATDAYITKAVWLSCYMTTFENLKKQAQKKGVSFNVEAADKEAVFQASQLISETQNTSLDMDMSYIMRKAKSNPALKPFVLFSSTPMNLMTNLAYGIPRNIRNKNWKGIAHTIAYVTLAMFGNMAINGAFRRKKDEDDEEFAKRMWIEIGAETVSTLMPGYGGSFASMIRGSFTDTTGDISLISDITRVGRKGIKKVLNPKDNQAGWELFGELLYVGAESFGFPAGAAKNLVKSAYNLNPGYLINKTFAEIFEENFK